MIILYIWYAFIYTVFAIDGIEAILQDPLVLSVIDEKSFKGRAGYYFSLRSVPLSQEQFIFIASPLKAGFMMCVNARYFVSHTMTVRDRKGFIDYFSGESCHVVLTIKEEVKIDGGVREYRGNLRVQVGSEKREFAVHGRYYE